MKTSRKEKPRLRWKPRHGSFTRVHRTEGGTDTLGESQLRLTDPVAHIVAHISTIKTFLTSSYESQRGEMEDVLSCRESTGDCRWRGMVGKCTWAWSCTMKYVDLELRVCITPGQGSAALQNDPLLCQLL